MSQEELSKQSQSESPRRWNHFVKKVVVKYADSVDKRQRAETEEDDVLRINSRGSSSKAPTVVGTAKK